MRTQSHSVSGADFVFKVITNTISNNQLGAATQAIGVRVDTPLGPEGILIENNVFSGHEVDVLVLSEAATTTVYCNSFSGTVGVQNDDTGVLDALYNWWGAEDGPGTVGPGTRRWGIH